MQEIISTIKKRRSIRQFIPKEIPKQAIEELIDCARMAPTARNVQPWEFIAITERKMLNEIGKLAFTGPFIKDCACCIAVCCKDTKYYLEDGCAATQNLLIAASSLNIGSCWVAGDKKEYSHEVLKLINVPDGFKLVSLIALGYAPNQNQETLEKRPVKEILHWQKF